METISAAQAAYDFLRNNTITASRIMKGYDLTYGEFFFCVLLLLEDMTLFYEHLGEGILNKKFKDFNRTSVDVLFEKGLVTKRWTDEEFPDDVELTKSFKKKLMDEFGFTKENIDETKQYFEKQKLLMDKFGNEFFKEYPSQAEINGKSVFLKNCNKEALGVKGKSQLIALYIKKIGEDEQLHHQIIEAIKQNKSEGVATHAVLKQNIVNFVDTEAWNDLINNETHHWDKLM